VFRCRREWLRSFMIGEGLLSRLAGVMLMGGLRRGLMGMGSGRMMFGDGRGIGRLLLCRLALRCWTTWRRILLLDRRSVSSRCVRIGSGCIFGCFCFTIGLLDRGTVGTDVCIYPCRTFLSVCSSTRHTATLRSSFSFVVFLLVSHMFLPSGLDICLHRKTCPPLIA